MSAPETSDLRKPRGRSVLLLPAVRLMNRLTYPRKFFLISVLFLAALSLVMYFLHLEYGERIDFTAIDSGDAIATKQASFGRGTLAIDARDFQLLAGECDLDANADDLVLDSCLRR